MLHFLGKDTFGQKPKGCVTGQWAGRGFRESIVADVL
jgi:hypothetical protein